EALFLTRYASRVRILHRRDKLRASKILQDRVFANGKIEMVWNTIPVEIVGEGGAVTGVKTRDTVTGEEGSPQDRRRLCLHRPPAEQRPFPRQAGNG
ncbi:MAG: NAD-binding protein, partial [Caldilinea sp.]|nr:NAD-binding protein [Caldilinea sp.]